MRLLDMFKRSGGSKKGHVRYWYTGDEDCAKVDLPAAQAANSQVNGKWQARKEAAAKVEDAGSKAKQESWLQSLGIGG